MVSDVTLGSVIGGNNQTGGASNQLAQDFNQFLSLLTTQLQNQDPLSPMDTTEFTNQIVAFTGVEQQINTNQRLDSLLSLQIGNALSSSIGYVGKDVSYISAEFNFDGTRPVDITYALDREAIDSVFRIENEEGEIIFEQDIPGNTGRNEFTWDGKDNDGNTVEPGTYSVRIDALDIDGNSINSTTVVTGEVRGVESQNGLIFLLVGDRAISLGNVLNVSEPPPPIPPTDDVDPPDDGDGDDGDVDDPDGDGGDDDPGDP